MAAAIEFRVIRLEPRDERNMVLVTLQGSQPEGQVNHGFTLTVFVPVNDSYAVIRTSAIAKARDMMIEFVARSETDQESPLI